MNRPESDSDGGRRHAKTIEVGYWVSLVLRAGVSLLRCHFGVVRAVDDRGMRITTADYIDAVHGLLYWNDLYVSWGHIGAIEIATPKFRRSASNMEYFLRNHDLLRNKFDGIPMPKNSDEEEAEAEAEHEHAAQDAANAADMASAIAQMSEQPAPAKLSTLAPPWRKPLPDGVYRAVSHARETEGNRKIYFMYFTVYSRLEHNKWARISNANIIPHEIQSNWKSGPANLAGPGEREKGHIHDGLFVTIHVTGCVPHVANPEWDSNRNFKCNLVTIMTESGLNSHGFGGTP